MNPSYRAIMNCLDSVGVLSGVDLLPSIERTSRGAKSSRCSNNPRPNRCNKSSMCKMRPINCSSNLPQKLRMLNSLSLLLNRLLRASCHHSPRLIIARPSTMNKWSSRLPRVYLLIMAAEISLLRALMRPNLLNHPPPPKHLLLKNNLP